MHSRIFRRYHRRLIREFEEVLRISENQFFRELERAFWLEHDIIMENRRRMESGEFRAVGINGVLNKN